MQSFKKTKAQKLAAKEIGKKKLSEVCIEGGSRSGKSFEIMREIIIRASRVPYSEHIICRETFNACKRSIWLKTMPDVFRIAFPRLPYYPMRSDGIYYAELTNGSKIFIAGLDDEKKLERLLGTEYSTIWFNETNQIPYPATTKLKTRLAQKNELVKRCYYDLNPTKTSSWPYQVFHQSVNPTDGEMLPNPEDYMVVKMNPWDNIENLDPEYIKKLENLPQKERLRFLQGDYDEDNSGCAVYAFNKEDHVSEEARRLRGTVFIGTDFNIDYNSDVLCSIAGDQIFIWDEIQIAGDTYKKADELIKKNCRGAVVIADSTGKNRKTSGKSDFRILEENGFRLEKTQNPYVVDKINNLNRCFTLGMIKIHPRCKKLIRDLTQLVWDKQGQLDQKSDPSLSHLVDCLAYICWKKFPIQPNYNAKIRIS